MKSILVHAADDSAMEARMQAALDIARATGAHITFLQAVSFEVFAPGDFYGSAMAAALPQIKIGFGRPVEDATDIVPIVGQALTLGREHRDALIGDGRSAPAHQGGR